MPSAASVKLDKPQTNNSTAIVAAKETTAVENVDNSSPIRQVIVIIDHKIRNLEKRKGKLESYRDIEKSGKELSADQKVAVSKYDEVAMTLDFAREFSKQIIQIATASERDLKKKQKKDETSKKQGETSKIREVLIIQDVLSQLTDDAVRKDFLAGVNGACKLEEHDLTLLDQFRDKVSPKRPTEPTGVQFKAAAQKSADHLVLTIDDNQKEFEGSTYANVKAILKGIQKCTYFDAAAPKTIESAEIVPPPADATVIPSDVEAAAPAVESNESELSSASNEDNAPQSDAALANAGPTYPEQQETSAATTPYFRTFPPPRNYALEMGSAPDAIFLAPNPSQPTHRLCHPQPTTVRAVEQGFFKQHQYMQQMRPVTEVIAGSNFFFLQDSELESPESLAATAGADAEFQPQPQQLNAPLNAQAPLQKKQQQQPAQQQQPSQQQRQLQQQPKQQQQPQPQQQQSQPTQPQQHQPPQQPPQQQQQPALLSSSTPSQIPSQTFTNQTFPPVVYTNIKPQQVSDLSVAATAAANQIPGSIQQPQIPGFAKPNAPIPIPILQPSVAPAAAGALNVNQTASTPIIPLVGGNFVAPVLNSSNATHPAPANLLPNVITKIASPTTANIPTVESIEQRVPEISEWKPEDANNSLKFNSKSRGRALGGDGGAQKTIGKDGLETNEWRDTFSYATNKSNQESNEWNNGLADDGNADESNTWSSGNNQRYQQNRQNFGRFNRPNRSDGGNGRNVNGNTSNFSANTNSTGGTANGYRNGGRSNSSYQSNGATRNNGGGNGTSNTYYRNDSYYQNGNSGAGCNGNFRDKPENYVRSNNYRSRDNRDGRDAQDARDNTSTFKNGASTGPALPQRNNSGVGNSNSNSNSNSNRLNVAADGSDRRLPNAGTPRTTNGPNKGQSSGGNGGNGGNIYRSVSGSNASGNRSQQQSAPINA